MSNGADSKVAENGTHLKHGSSSEREDISGACDGGGGLRGDNLAANGVYGKIAFVPQGVLDGASRVNSPTIAAAADGLQEAAKKVWTTPVASVLCAGLREPTRRVFRPPIPIPAPKPMPPARLMTPPAPLEPLLNTAPDPQELMVMPSPVEELKPVEPNGMLPVSPNSSRRCSVKDCATIASPCPLRLYAFPTAYATVHAKRWISFCGQKRRWKPDSESFVCSRHFHDSWYLRSSSDILQWDAVPGLCPPWNRFVEWKSEGWEERRSCTAVVRDGETKNGRFVILSSQDTRGVKPAAFTIATMDGVTMILPVVNAAPPDNCPSVSEPAATSVPSNTSCFSENLKRSVDFVESGNEGSASLSGPSRKKRASSGRFICTSTSQSGQSVKKLRWEKTSTFRRERKLLGDASEGNETSPLSDSLRIVDRNAVSDMLDGSCATAAESEDCSMEAVVSAPLTGSTRKKKKPYGQVPMPWDCFRPLWNSIGGLISLQEKGRSLQDTDLAQSVAIPVDEGGARGERTAVQLYDSTNGILSPSRLLANHLPSSLEPDELLQPLVSKPLHSARPMIIKRWIQGSARTQAYGPGAVDASRAERIMLVDATLALSVQSALGMESEETFCEEEASNKKKQRGLELQIKRKDRKIKELLDKEQSLKAELATANRRVDPATLPPILRELVHLSAIESPTARRYSSELMEFACKMYKHSRKSLITARAHGLFFPSLRQVSKLVTLERNTAPTGELESTRKPTVRFTPVQLDALYQSYAECKYPAPEVVRRLAAELDVPFPKIKKWFHHKIYLERCSGTLPWTDETDKI